MPCVLRQAWSLQASHGGKAHNDPLDSQQMAGLLRGGRLPQAAVSPAARRATRALLRRRRPRRRKRAALLAHGQPTHSHDTLPGLGPNRASKAKREGRAARWPAPAVQQSSAVDLALIGPSAPLFNDVACPSVPPAPQPAPPPWSRRPSVPGIGTRLRLGLLDALPPIDRWPR